MPTVNGNMVPPPAPAGPPEALPPFFIPVIYGIGHLIRAGVMHAGPLAKEFTAGAILSKPLGPSPSGPKTPRPPAPEPPSRRATRPGEYERDVEREKRERRQVRPWWG